MAGLMAMNRDQVDRQLKELTRLLDLVDSQSEPIGTAKAHQNTAWSEIDACKVFAGNYTSAIGEIELAMKEIRDSIGTALANVRDSASAVTKQDESLRSEYANLANRLNQGPPAPAPAIATSVPSLIHKLLTGQEAGSVPFVEPAAAVAAVAPAAGTAEAASGAFGGTGSMK